MQNPLLQSHVTRSCPRLRRPMFRQIYDSNAHSCILAENGIQKDDETAKPAKGSQSCQFQVYYRMLFLNDAN